MSDNQGEREAHLAQPADTEQDGAASVEANRGNISQTQTTEMKRCINEKNSSQADIWSKFYLKDYFLILKKY